MICDESGGKVWWVCVSFGRESGMIDRYDDCVLVRNI